MDSFLFPPSLKKGDSVGVISPSDFIEKSDIEKSLSIVKSWGLEVVLGEHVYDQEDGFAAGSATDRFDDLRKMVFDDKIKIIWCSFGGFAATQLWPFIDENFVKKLKSFPKLIMGYSDVCVLSHLWFRFGVSSIHGPNLLGFSSLDKESQMCTKRLLFDDGGEKQTLIDRGVSICEGISKGRLLCTNLDSLVACFGTKFDPFDYGDEDLILGIEEFEQYKSDIQRQIDMIMNHKRAGRIKGFILGNFRDLKFDVEYSNWFNKNETWRVISKRIMAVNRKIPVISWPNFGHFEDRFIAFKNGIRVELVSKGNESTLIEI